MRKILPFVVQAILLFTTTINSAAQPVIGFSPFISSGLSAPVDITNAGDGTSRLFIVQQSGSIRIHNGISLLPAPFLNISSIITTGGERGLLSLAFHPDYENNRYFFVYYTNLSGDITIARYQADAANPNLADPLSGVVLMNIPKPFSNHNGGDLNFGPDGYLYFGTGDGGSGGDPFNFSQTGTSLLGKMIRIDVSNFSTPPYYTIPPDNPYVSDPNVDDHIWALGLRNPWRWSFDRSTGNMWIADVGQSALEEINFRTAGSTGGINYGWRCYEGNQAYNTTGCLPQSNYIQPVFVYPHSAATGGFSVTGGFVYRGAEYPALQGYYICADYVSSNVWLITPDGLGGWTTRMQTGLPGSISSFGEAEDGTLYAVSLGGTVYKVILSAVLPLNLLSFTGSRMNGYNELKWKTADEQNLLKFIIEYSSDGRLFSKAGEMAATGLREYSFRHYINETGKLFYRLKTEELNGPVSFSPVISIGAAQDGGIKIFPSFIKGNRIQVIAGKPVQMLRIINLAGSIIFTKDLGSQQGLFTVELPSSLSKGLHLVRIETTDGFEVIKIIKE